jgi:hypothetical protein
MRRGQGGNARGGRERAHVQRMSRRKGVLALARKRDAVAEHRLAIRTRLIEHRLQAVRHKGGRNSDQQCVVAGALQLLRPAPCRNPAGDSQSQKDLLVGAPGEPARDHLGTVGGVTRDRPRDPHVRLRGFYRD